MVRIYDANTDKFLGTLNEGELQFLLDTLEEETTEDKDYYIDLATLGYLKDRGADPAVLKLLTEAIGDGDYVNIRWE